MTVVLPNEVVDRIAQFLPKKSLKACFYISKAWYLSASKHYYSKITFTNNHQEVFRQITHVRVYGYSIARFVKMYEVLPGTDYTLPEEFMTFDQFVELMASSHALDTIRFDRMPVSIHYLKYMSWMSLDQLPNIRMIDLVPEKPHNTEYGAVITAREYMPKLHRLLFTNNLYMAHTITRMNMLSAFEFSGPRLTHTIEKLKRFKRLQVLRILQGPAQNLWKPLLGNHPTLTHLYYRSLGEKMDSFKDLPFDHPEPITRLLHLELSVRDFTSSDLTFLQHSVPLLRSLCLTVQSCGFQAWMRLRARSGFDSRTLVSVCKDINFLALVFFNRDDPMAPLDFSCFSLWDLMEEGYEKTLVIRFDQRVTGRPRRESIRIDQVNKKLELHVGYFLHHFRDFVQTAPLLQFTHTHLTVTAIGMYLEQQQALYDRFKRYMTTQQKLNSTFKFVPF